MGWGMPLAQDALSWPGAVGLGLSGAHFEEWFFGYCGRDLEADVGLDPIDRWIGNLRWSEGGRVA
jgi:hypothetical protein